MEFTWTPAPELSTIEIYTAWLATLSPQDLQDELDERSFDTALNDTGQWGDYDARFRATLAEQRKRIFANPHHYFDYRD
jgi:hypothetical protein